MSTTIAADALYREVLARVCRRPVSMTVDEWADEHRVLVMSARRGPWRTDAVPYLREIMRAYTDPIVREITLIKGAQLGGSEALYNMIMRDIDVDPRDTLLVYPTIEVARAVMKRRLAPAIQTVPTLRTHLSGRARDVSALSMTFSGCTLAMVGSNSPSGLESFPLSRVFVDELDRCEPTTLEQVRERQKTFADAKLIKTGTPSMQGAGIDAEYRGVSVRDEDGSETGEFVGASSRRTYWVPCPECGVYHRRRFADIRWEGGRRADPAAVKRTAHMRCPARGCGKKILASSNLWQLQMGVWAPHGCTVTPMTRLEGGLDGQPGRAIDRSGRTPAFVEHEGYAITGLYSALEANPYGAVASKFVRGGCAWTENFVTRVIGMAYRQRGRSAAEAAVNALRDPTHAMRTVPREALRLTMAIDVQTDRAFVEVLAWGPFGRTCWLVDCFSVPTTMGLNLAELDEVVLRRRWPKLVPDAKGPVPSAFLRPACVMIDTGDRTDEVYRAVKRWAAVPGAPAITPTKGDSTMGRGASPPHRLTVISPDRLKSDAAGIGAGLMLLLINTHYWKDTVLARLSGERDAEQASQVEEWSSGAEESEKRESGKAGNQDSAAKPLPSPVPSPQSPVPAFSDPDRWIMPRDMPGEYARQLTSEHLVRRMVQGRPKYVWEMKPGISDNHFLDCRVMNMAGADLHGVGRMAPPPPPPPSPPGQASPSGPAPGSPPGPGNVKQSDYFGSRPQLQNPSANRSILSASTLRPRG